MTTKKAEHEFGYDHEYNQNPNNWRRGEGLGLNLRMATGDPKALKKKQKGEMEDTEKKAEVVNNKYLEKIAEMQDVAKTSAIFGAAGAVGAGAGSLARKAALEYTGSVDDVMTHIMKDQGHNRAAFVAKSNSIKNKAAARDIRPGRAAVKSGLIGALIGAGYYGLNSLVNDR